MKLRSNDTRNTDKLFHTIFILAFIPMFKPLIQIFTVLYFSLILSLFTACQPSDLSKKALMQQTSAFLEKEEPEAAIQTHDGPSGSGAAPAHHGGSRSSD